MNEQEKFEYLEKYLKKHFEEWLVKDIQMIKDAKLHFTFPYILSVSAGIDFLGMLAKGFGSKSGDRSRYFIEEWMGRIKINPLYKNEKMSNLIYKSARCGSSHQAIYKRGIESSSRAYPEGKHLYHIKCLDGEDRIFIHAWQFVDDFFKAQRLFRDEYVKSNTEEVFDNLQEMLREGVIDGFQELIEELKKDGKSFNAEEELKNNPKVKSFDKENLRIEFYDEEECTPSAAPKLDSSTHSSTTTSQPKDYPITALPEEAEGEEIQ